MAGAPELKIQITAEAQAAATALSQLASSVRKLQGDTQAVGTQAKAAGDSIAAGFFKASMAVDLVKKAFSGLVSAGKDVIDTGLRYEKILRTLQFATGDGAGAMAFAKKISNDLGLELMSTAEAYAKLAASARGTSLEGKKVDTVFEAVASASTVMGLSADETKGTLLALSQMIGKGKVQAEELRGQLGERLPGAFQIAARAMGMTTQELDKQLQLGKVYAEDFLPKFAAQLKKELGDAPQTAAQSFQAALNRAQNAWTEFNISINKDGFAKVMQQGLAIVGSFAQDALQYVRAMVKEFSAWASDGLAKIAAWYKEHKQDINEILNATFVQTKQFAGLLLDIVAIATGTNNWNDSLKAIKFQLQEGAKAFGAMRDMLAVLVFLSDTVGYAWRSSFFGPLANALDGMSKLAGYAGKTEWATKLAAGAEEVRKSFGNLEAGAARVKDILKGKGSYAQVLEDLKGLTKELGEETKRTQKEIATKPPPPEVKSKKDLVTHEESLARLTKLRAEGAEKITLEDKRQADLLAAQADMVKDIARLNEEKTKGKFKRAGGEEDYQAELQAHQDLYKQRVQNIDAKYAMERKRMEAKLQSDLTALEEGGLEKRLDAIRDTFSKIREENDKLAKDGATPFSSSQIDQAEAAAMSRARIDQVKADLSALKQELAELAQIKGRALSLGEQAEVMDRFAQKSATARDAVQKLREEMHLGDGAAAGFRNALDAFIIDSQNSFENWKTTTQNVLQGMQSAFSNFFQSIFEKGKTGAQKWDALWKGIASTVLGALANMAAKWLVAAAAQAIFGKSVQTVAMGEAVANQAAAAAGIFAAHAYIPFAGPAIATGYIAMMQGVLAANLAAAKTMTKFAVGGLIDRPTMALMGEAGPEVVAPQKDFLSWSAQLQAAGASMAATIADRERSSQLYQSQAAGYVRSAYGTGYTPSAGGNTIYVQGDVYAQDSRAFQDKVMGAVRKYESRRA